MPTLVDSYSTHSHQVLAECYRHHSGGMQGWDMAALQGVTGSRSPFPALGRSNDSQPAASSQPLRFTPLQHGGPRQHTGDGRGMRLA
jgi:hypothetical protein